MSTYERIYHVLEDHEWHSLRELEEICHFPEEWLDELRRDGYEVLEDDDELEQHVKLLGEPADLS